MRPTPIPFKSNCIYLIFFDTIAQYDSTRLNSTFEVVRFSSLWHGKIVSKIYRSILNTRV
jgi:hypothetical protein